MGRRRNENTLNLFAFQDIITGVAGVMLFILLLLVVQLTLRTAIAATEAKPQPVVPEVIEPIRDEQQRLETLKKELEELRQRGAELLRAEATDLDAKINAAEAELQQLVATATEQKAAAESLESQMTTETSEQKASTLEKRNALLRQLEELKQEQAQHAGGKLVAFKAESTGTGELWIVDMRATKAAIFNVRSPEETTWVEYDQFEPAILIVQPIRQKLNELTKTRNIVVLIRPSVAGIGSELLAAFRVASFNVALEILDEDTQVTPPSEAVK